MHFYNKNMIEKLRLNSNFWIFAAIVAIFAGITLRTFGWLQGHSFNLDEGDLIVNFRNLSYLGLFGPLEFDEQAPPFFLVIGKFLYSTFGYNEIILRSVGYISSCLSLFVFFFLCKKVYNNNFSVFAALLFMSLNLRLIYHAQTFKQYSSEMLIDSLAVLIFLNIDWDKFDKNKAAIWGLIAGLSFWASYSIVFIIGGLSLTYLARFFIEKNKEKLKCFAYFIIPVIASLALYLQVNLGFVLQNKTLYSFWQIYTGFFPTSLAPIEYIWRDTASITLAATALLIIGSIRFYNKDKYKFFAIASPILMTLLASALLIYPFGARLLVFLFPFFIILTIKPLDYIGLKNKLYSSAVIALFIVFCGYLFSSDYKEIIRNKDYYKQSTAREFINILKKQDLKKEEYLYVGIDANRSINSYDTNKEIIDTIFIPEHVIYEKKFSLNSSLDRIPKNATVYFYLADYIWDREYSKHIMPWIDKHCTILDRVEEKTGTFIKCRNDK